MSPEEPVESYYQGIFLTETVLGNPNGSFVNNEPRNINGRVFTTDKCIKYNIRNYIHQNYEDLDSLDHFVFFYPRKTEDAESHEASFMTKDTVFEEYFDEDFEELLEKSVDARIFGGTFSFTGGGDKYIYGPVQISYGLDLIGADIISHKVGTPFASEDGHQKTTGESRVVDHAVISYDISVNPKNTPELLKKDDLEMFKEGIIRGTNLRKSTSKNTNAKALLMVRFTEGESLNVGELKHLIDVDSKKLTDPAERPEELVLDFSRLKDRLEDYRESIEEIEVYKDGITQVNNFFNQDKIVIEKGFDKFRGE